MTDNDRQQDAGTTEQHESNYNREIQPGDIVRDLWSGKKLYVISVEAETVADWDAKQSDGSKSMLEYEGSIGTGATAGDVVYRCVFLKSNSSFSAGRKSYDYPESRLARFAHESAAEGVRTQDRIRAKAFATVMAGYGRGAIDAPIDRMEELIADAWSDELATLSRELYEARFGEQQAFEPPQGEIFGNPVEDTDE